MIATEFGHMQIVEFLLEETDISLEVRCRRRLFPRARAACVRRARAAQSKNVEGETAIFYPVKNKNPDMVRMLCEFGANVNVASYMKDTPLKAACRANNIEIVNALLDWRATRRPSAFDLLKGYAKGEIDRRLEIERKEKQAEAEAAIKAKQGKKGQKFQQGSKSEYGEWRPYLDKRKRGIFYYNRVSRVSQFEVRASVCHARVLLAVEVRACPFQLPEDYVKDKTYIMKDATYGMHFYH